MCKYFCSVIAYVWKYILHKGKSFQETYLLETLKYIPSEHLQW